MVMAFSRDDTAVEARWDDTTLFRYVYRPDEPQLESPRPYFHPVRPFACVCPAPFFAAEHEVPAGSLLTLRYDVVIADGQLDPGRCRSLAARLEGTMT
jgi:hypothetical protein